MSGKEPVFTPAERLVVILTLLVVILLSWWNLEKGMRLQRDLSRKADLERISQGLALYWQVYQVFPEAGPKGEVLACGPEGKLACAFKQKWEDANGVYLDSFPADPRFSPRFNWSNYGYRVDSQEGRFWLWAFLERASDEDIIPSQERCPGSWEENQYLICASS
jgi:hypothetical protein